VIETLKNPFFNSLPILMISKMNFIRIKSFRFDVFTYLLHHIFIFVLFISEIQDWALKDATTVKANLAQRLAVRK